LDEVSKRSGLGGEYRIRLQKVSQNRGRRALMAPEGLRRIMQEIQVADYELHASFRIIANRELESEHISAFMAASIDGTG
jgi:hypothetical protein